MTTLPLPEPLAPYAPLIIGFAQASFVLAIAWIAGRWVHKLGLRLFRARKIDETVARFLAALLQYGALAAGVIAALDSVGFETTSLVAILGSAAIAIGLALQGTLANFAAGVMLLIFRPFTLGDTITIAAHTGTVEEIGLFATVLVTAEHNRVVIPNAQVTAGAIVNQTILGTRRSTIAIKVPPQRNPDQVMTIASSTAEKTPGVLAEPAPLVRLDAFEADAVTFTLHVWSKPADVVNVGHEVRVAVHAALAKAGIANASLTKV